MNSPGQGEDLHTVSVEHKEVNLLLILRKVSDSACPSFSLFHSFFQFVRTFYPRIF